MTDHAFRQKRAMVAQLWKDMAAAYGSLWTKDGGVETERFATWVDNLAADFTTSEIRDGILRMRKRTDKYPPTLPEFRSVIEANRPRPVPQNCTDEFKRQTEHTGAKLLAGKAGNQGNRVVMRDGVYVHVIKRDGKWIDAEWQRNCPDGLMPMHQNLANPLKRKSPQ